MQPPDLRFVGQLRYGTVDNILDQESENDQTVKWPLLSIPPALRYRAYRAYWTGSLASVAGFQMLVFTQLWLMRQLESSPIFLGYVGLATALPAIILNLWGGVLADRLDKRRLIISTQSLTACLVFLLATITLLDLVRVSHVLAIAFVTGAVNAFDQPARQAL